MIFPMFAKNFELIREGPKPSDTQSGGFFASDDSSTDDPKPICEPLITETQAQTLQMGVGGTYKQYDYEWWSTTHYPYETLIKYGDIYLILEKEEPYWAEGGFAIYYLKNRSDHDDL